MKLIHVCIVGALLSLMATCVQAAYWNPLNITAVQYAMPTVREDDKPLEQGELVGITFHYCAQLSNESFDDAYFRCHVHVKRNRVLVATDVVNPDSDETYWLDKTKRESSPRPLYIRACNLVTPDRKETAVWGYLTALDSKGRRSVYSSAYHIRREVCGEWAFACWFRNYSISLEAC